MIKASFYEAGSSLVLTVGSSQTVKKLVNQRLKMITDKNQERNIYKFTEGRIVDYNNGKNLNN